MHVCDTILGVHLHQKKSSWVGRVERLPLLQDLVGSFERTRPQCKSQSMFLLMGDMQRRSLNSTIDNNSASIKSKCVIDVLWMWPEKGLTQFETAKHRSRFSRFTWSLCSAKSWIKHAYRFALWCHLVENTGIPQMTFLQQVLRILKQFGMLEQGHHSNILLLHGFLCVKTKTQEAVQYQSPRSRISDSAVFSSHS